MKNYRVVLMNKRDYNKYMAGNNQITAIGQLEVYVEANTKAEALAKADGYRNKVATIAIELG